MNPSLENGRAPRKSLFLLASALAVVGAARAAEPAPPSAEPARLAAQSLLIAVATAGPRLVAVGDRGIILLSDDRGGSWVQALEVPTQALLTGVCFLDAEHGVAVGHDEVILATADAGRTWRRSARCWTCGVALADMRSPSAPTARTSPARTVARVGRPAS
ncbi:MAG TPA: hypothetical protein VN835_08795 [Steroidobacteraceae bacterium]|nr:hypothetical protein [Steroidobacteraceae bacterium]